MKRSWLLFAQSGLINMKKLAMKKTISWYIVHLIMVSFIAFFVTHKISIAATIASAELVTETFIFYAHEKIWQKIKLKSVNEI